MRIALTALKTDVSKSLVVSLTPTVDPALVRLLNSSTTSVSSN
jgi:hypothetical protein